VSTTGISVAQIILGVKAGNRLKMQNSAETASPARRTASGPFQYNGVGLKIQFDACSYHPGYNNLVVF